MSLSIAELHIENLRSIADKTLPLQNLAVMVGRNNAGKSNALAAVQLLLEGGTRDLREEDFYAEGDERAEAFTITATLTGASRYLPLLERVHRTKIQPCVEDDKIRLQRTATRIPKLQMEKLQIWQPAKEAFGLPTGIDAALKQFLPEVIFIEAFKDPTSEAVGKSTATLGRILKQIVASVEARVRDELETAFQAAKPMLNVLDEDGRTRDERVPELKGVEELIRLFVSGVFEDADVRLEFTFPDVSGLFSSVGLKLKDRGEWTTPERQGQGFQRMLYFALLRALAHLARGNGEGLSRPFVLLFEDPEAFLHPSLMTQLAEALDDISTTNQVLTATHSPMMVTPQRIENVVLVRRDRSTSFAVPDLEAVQSAGDRQLARLLKLTNSAEFLFADRVLVVEGPSDKAVFEALWHRRRDLSIDPCHLAVIEAESKDVVHVWRSVLEAMGIEASGVVDLDFLWRGAGKLLRSDAAYSRFCEEFHKRATEQGLMGDAQPPRVKEGKKREAFELVAKQFETARDELCTRIRDEFRIWVLGKGDMETCAGLSRSSKAGVTKRCREIRDGAAEVDPELVGVLRWAAEDRSLQPSVADTAAPVAPP